MSAVGWRSVLTKIDGPTVAARSLCECLCVCACVSPLEIMWCVIFEKEIDTDGESDGLNECTSTSACDQSDRWSGRSQ